MSRKQIEYDFSQLYPQKNKSKLIEEYYKGKKRDVLIVFLAGMLLSFLLLYSDYQKLNLAPENLILRKEETGGLEEVKLQVKKEGEDWKEIEFDLKEKQWSEKELEEAFIRITEELQKYILGKNTSFDQITEDLNFITDISGYPFTLSWESGNSELIDHSGRLQEKIIKETATVQILMKASYYDWQQEYLFYITIPETRQEAWIISLKENLKAKEERTREEKHFYLPESFEGQKLSWKYQGKNTGIYMPIITIILILIVWHEKDREINRKTEQRKKQLMKEYPGLISRLVLYLGTGVSVKESFLRLQEEYIKDSNHSYLKEEMEYVCSQLKNGLSEIKVYEALAERCKIAEYKKLSALLIQQREKGSYHLLEQLKKEMEAANEEQYKRLKKEGEEIGTRLLLPMMMLLGMVMALIMLPALFSFQT